MKRCSDNSKAPLCKCGCGKPVIKNRNGTYNSFLHGHNSKSGQPSNNGNSSRFQLNNKHGKGRPQGSKNAVTIAAQHVLEEQAAVISEKAVEMALSGDRMMIQMIMSKILPTKKSIPVSLPDFPQVTSISDISLVTGYILQAIADGKLSPVDAQTISNCVARHTASLTIVDLEKRLSDLEISLIEGQGDSA